MHNKLVKDKMHKEVKKSTPWDLAIEDAEEQMINTLKRSIRIFAEARDRGDQWRGEILPGTQSENQKLEPCHSV
jgi:hypothetical protein